MIKTNLKMLLASALLALSFSLYADDKKATNYLDNSAEEFKELSLSPEKGIAYLIALPAEKQKDFISYLSSSHIESYVNLIEPELNISDDDLDKLSDKQYELFISKSDLSTSLQLSLKDKIAEEELRKIEEENIKGLETIKKKLRSIKQTLEQKNN